MSATPRKLRSQGPVTPIDLENPTGKPPAAPTDHLNVEQELGFYAAFHSNNINKAIHFVCIPMILWSGLPPRRRAPRVEELTSRTALIILAQIKLPYETITVLSPGFAFQLNGALLLISSYTAYYFLLEPFAAATFTPIAVLMYLTATYLANIAPLSLPLRDSGLFGLAKPSSMPFTIVLHVSSWIAQFIGHGVFEGRAPALMTSLVQALVLAPFFVHLEMLFTFFDYRPELHKAMINAASKRIVAMNRASKRAM